MINTLGGLMCIIRRSKEVFFVMYIHRMDI